MLLLKNIDIYVDMSDIIYTIYIYANGSQSNETSLQSSVGINRARLCAGSLCYRRWCIVR